MADSQIGVAGWIDMKAVRYQHGGRKEEKRQLRLIQLAELRARRTALERKGLKSPPPKSYRSY